MKNYIIVLLALFLTSSCSSIIKKEDCSKDMKAFGLDHGKRGLDNYSDQLRKTCTTNTQSINLEGYQSGFNMGWSAFCTSFHGYEIGQKGDIYKSYCPKEKESLFHEKFLIGKSVYDKKDQVLEVEDIIKELNKNLEKDPNSADLNKELKNNKERLKLLNREIQALQQKGLSLVHTN